MISLQSGIFSPGGLVLLLLAVIIVLIGIWLILAYNRLTRTRIQIEKSWSQVSVQVKLRADLIPKLVQIVQGYATHEKETLVKVMETRTRYLSAGTTESAIESSGDMGNWLHRLMAIAEQYPDLKEDGNYQQLQQQLTDIEQKIALARKFYNDAVMLFNRLVQLFPSSIVASLFGFEKKPFFEHTAEEADPPGIRLN
ncbi:MAG: LemA family protein [Bacillota bacterium]|nr:LemA family protein [Bacillota bacterium]